MYNFPFFPHFYPRPYYSYPQTSNMNVKNNTIYHSRINQESLSRNVGQHQNANNNQHQSNKSNSHNDIMKTISDNKNYNYEESNKKFSKSKSSKNDDYDNEIIEILGIKLHQDDILLICLIFFLYQEGVKDEFLFIVLILLLLS